MGFGKKLGFDEAERFLKAGADDSLRKSFNKES